MGAHSAQLALLRSRSTRISLWLGGQATTTGGARSCSPVSMGVPVAKGSALGLGRTAVPPLVAEAFKELPRSLGVLDILLGEQEIAPLDGNVWRGVHRVRPLASELALRNHLGRV